MRLSKSVLCCLAALALCAPPARGAASSARIDLGKGYMAEVDPRGVVKIMNAERCVLREAFVGTWVDGKFSDQLQAIKIEGAERNGFITRSGVIPRPGVSAKYRVFVRVTPPGPKGLRDLLLTYVVETPLFPKATAAVLLRFPIAEYAGKSVFVDSVGAGAFPKKQQKNATFVSRPSAHDFLAKQGAAPVIFVGRQAPGTILVQDSRKWGANAYEAQFALTPTRSQPPSRRALRLVISLAGKRGPTVAKLETNSPPAVKDMPSGVPKYGMFEVSVDLWARFDNPYDAKEIEVTGLFTQPDKTVRTMRGFIYQGFERHLVAGKEQLTPIGPHQWRVRFTPTQTGKHSFKVRVKTKADQHETKLRTFHAVESDAPGFVMVHKGNPKYFQRSDGKTFFLVGHNVCWSSKEKRTYDYDAYFRRMGNAGENYTRVWMCSWDTGIEGRRLDSYRLDAAWRLDYILELARSRGIYVKVCFDNELDYSTREGKRNLFGCWKENGGPCVKVMDFFTHPVSKAAYRRRLDYIVARWGYSPHVMAWELWNEMNYLAASDSRARGILVNWTEEMAGHLKQNDPYRHLVTTSLGLHTTWDELWDLKDIDFAQVHAYLPQPEAAKAPEEKDAVLSVLNAFDRIARFKKPAHVSEFGYLDLPNINRTNEKDPGGIHLHNAIWGGLFSGAAGTPANWWWANYVHERNLYRHYAAAAGFLHGIDLADKGWKHVITAGRSGLRIIGIKKRDRCALWIQRKGNNWYRRIAQERPLVQLEKLKIRVPNVEPGQYKITWWDTSAGEITHYRQRAVRRDTDAKTFDLMLEYESGAADIAVKAERLR